MPRDEPTERVLALLDTLGPPQRDAAVRAFDDRERRAWQYTPGRRSGLSLAEMDRRQAKATHRLLAASLALDAYARLATIMSLEDVLDTLEGGRRGRHAGDYWLAVFGEPRGAGPWGWRFEGHHVSVNHTVVAGEVSAAPVFLGANPAAVPSGSGAALVRPLGIEEDLGLAVVGSLDARQRDRAVVADDAPPDIQTGNRQELAAPLEPRGVAGRDLGTEARDLLRRLAGTYLERLPPAQSAAHRTGIDDGIGDLWFGWAGDPAPGRPHYYRLQGPRFLAELDNTQNGANHVHTVVRDPEGDFGEDLLRAHRLLHHGVPHAGGGEPAPGAERSPGEVP